MKTKRDKILELIFPVYKIRQDTKKMVFLHLKLKENSKIASLDSMLPLLTFKFAKDSGQIFPFEAEKEIFIYTDNPRNQSFAYFDKLVYDNFSKDDIKLEVSDIDDAGIILLSNKIRALEPNDEVIKISLDRLTRNGNSILVLDDDHMVLKTMENILKYFGRVSVTTDTDTFFKQYKEQAPNIVFIDMHLGEHRGSDVVKRIKSEIDPHAHAIMISADVTRDTVLEVKEVGINGYVVKPFNRDMIYKHLMKAPTFFPKKS